MSRTVDSFVRAIDTSDFDKPLQMLEYAHAQEAATAAAGMAAE